MLAQSGQRAPPVSPLPHAAMGVRGTISTTFAYDRNGNQTSGLGRRTTWLPATSPPALREVHAPSASDVDLRRFRQITPEGSALYIGAFSVLAELADPGTIGAQWTDYLSVGNAKREGGYAGAAECVGDADHALLPHRPSWFDLGSDRSGPGWTTPKASLPAGFKRKRFTPRSVPKITVFRPSVRS